MLVCFVFFFKQETAYEMRISDWSSDVCSSDLLADLTAGEAGVFGQGAQDVARAQLVFFSAVYAKSNHGRAQAASGRGLKRLGVGPHNRLALVLFDLIGPAHFMRCAQT